MKKMNFSRISSEEIRDMFEVVFEDQVAKYNNIVSFDVECVRAVGKDYVESHVTISGHAGTPTIDEFRNGKVKDASPIVISRYDVGDLTFELLKDQIVFLSGNDYVLVYRSI
jgi:hypothetical protein